MYFTVYSLLHTV